MKKTFFLLATLFCLAACTNSETTPPAGMNNGAVMMKDGKMMMMKDGKMTMMDTDVTMANGSKVMTNGEMMHSDGSKMMLTEGMMVDAQ